MYPSALGPSAGTSNMEIRAKRKRWQRHLEEAISYFHFGPFYLGRRAALARAPPSGFHRRGLAEESRPQINSAIYGPSLSNCSPRDGKYCSLSKITGCCNAPKACFMADHKCSQGEAARVGLISAPEESQSVTRVPPGTAVMDVRAAQGKRGEPGTLLCITPGLPIPMATQDEGAPLLAGPREFARPSHSSGSAAHQTFAIPLTDKWIGDLATCCHLPRSLWTLCNPEGLREKL